MTDDGREIANEAADLLFHIWFFCRTLGLSLTRLSEYCRSGMQANTQLFIGAVGSDDDADLAIVAGVTVGGCASL